MDINQENVNEFKIDKSKVLSKIRSMDSFSDKEEIIELLGGDKLRKIFDDKTISYIIKSFETNENFYNDKDLNILEGLLNGNIEGNLGNFYNVKFDYIKSLSKEQKRVLAQSFAGDIKSLEELLVNLWENEIETVACGGNNPMNVYVWMKIPPENKEQVKWIFQTSKEKKLQLDNLSFAPDGKLDICIDGDDLNLYSTINDSLNEYRTRKNNENVDNVTINDSHERKDDVKKEKFSEEEILEAIQDIEIGKKIEDNEYVEVCRKKRIKAKESLGVDIKDSEFDKDW